MAKSAKMPPPSGKSKAAVKKAAAKAKAVSSKKAATAPAAKVGATGPQASQT